MKKTILLFMASALCVPVQAMEKSGADSVTKLTTKETKGQRKARLAARRNKKEEGCIFIDQEILATISHSHLYTQDMSLAVLTNSIMDFFALMQDKLRFMGEQADTNLCLVGFLDRLFKKNPHHELRDFWQSLKKMYELISKERFKVVYQRGISHERWCQFVSDVTFCADLVYKLVSFTYDPAKKEGFIKEHEVHREKLRSCLVHLSDDVKKFFGQDAALTKSMFGRVMMLWPTRLSFPKIQGGTLSITLENLHSVLDGDGDIDWEVKKYTPETLGLWTVWRNQFLDNAHVMISLILVGEETEGKRFFKKLVNLRDFTWDMMALNMTDALSAYINHHIQENAVNQVMSGASSAAGKLLFIMPANAHETGMINAEQKKWEEVLHVLQKRAKWLRHVYDCVTVFLHQRGVSTPLMPGVNWLPDPSSEDQSLGYKPGVLHLFSMLPTTGVPMVKGQHICEDDCHHTLLWGKDKPREAKLTQNHGQDVINGMTQGLIEGAGDGDSASIKACAVQNKDELEKAMTGLSLASQDHPVKR